jgi:hypothetical protein
MRLIFRLLVMVWISVVAASVSSAADEVLYVSPQGNDSWSGKLAEPNADKSDGPFASLTAARDAVRRTKRASDSQPVRVLIRGGVYPIEKPVIFQPEDSGSAMAPVTYAAYPGEQPVISGGRALGSWRKGEGELWTVHIPSVQDGSWHFRQLFVGGRRAVPARSPNDGYFYPAGPLQPLKNREAARRDPSTRSGFKYRESDLRSWPDLEDAVLVYYHAWTTSRHLIRSLDEPAREVHSRNRSSWPFGWWGDRERYYVEGIRAALDAPGEFYLDRATGVLSYWPRPGESMERSPAVAAVAEDLVRLEGDVGAGKFVEYLRLEGLSFQHTSWSMPREGSVDGQAAAFLDTAALFARGARSCQLVRCEIAHTGGYGLWLENGCQGNLVEQCHLHDLGAGGIRLGHMRLPDEPQAQAERNEVVNCFIHDGGHVFHAGVGVWIGRTSHNRVVHNDICDFYYTGVSVGWSWGYASSTAHDNAIEYNRIHHLGWRQLSDMGGIYCLGVSPGTRLRHNVIHDVMTYPTGYGGWGLYTDEGSTGILIENNVVYRTKDGGFHQHYGRDNVVRNNILALSCGRGQVVRTRDESHRSFTFERNIVYYQEPPLLGSNWKTAAGYELDYNLYWRTGGTPPEFPGGLTLEQWQAQGHDEHSMVADPKFVAPERYDFRLQDDSPALRLGFQPLDDGLAGLRGPTEWTSLPQQVKRPPFIMPWEE